METIANTLTVPREWERQFESLAKTEAPAELLKLPQNRFLAPLIKPGLRVLEAGSGNGRYVFAFARAGVAEAVGVDFSERLVTKMLNDARRMGLENVSGTKGDILNLPFPDESFDLYTSFGVYEHFVPAQHEVLFREAMRVLKPGGTLFLEVPHFWSAWTVRRELRYWARKNGSMSLVWQRNLKRNYMVRCGEQAGFRTQKSQVFDAAYGFEKGFTLAERKLLGLPSPFFHLRPAFDVLAGWCEKRQWLGHTLVYIGRKPRNSKGVA